MLKLILIFIVSITLTGCFNSWSKEEKQLLKTHAKTMSMFIPVNKVQYTKCFEEYILENYSAKEYLNDVGSPVAMAMQKCMK